MMWFVGIDPGLSGGIAMLDASGNLISLARMPLIASGRSSGKDAVSTMGIIDMLRCDNPALLRIAIERLGARPNQSVQSVQTAGVNYGRVEGALHVLGSPVEYVQPQVWQKAVGVPALAKGASAPERKRASRATAERIMPSPLLTALKASDDGLWEAALIGLYCFRAWVKQ